MSYAILRMEKIKSFGQMKAADDHNRRLREVENADPERTPKNRELVELTHRTLVETVKAHLEKNEIRKWRKDAVLATEVLMTASPEFFHDPKNSIEAWTEANMKWLRARFGENLVHAVLHLDEATPHIHAMVVPIIEGKLANKRFFGGERDAFGKWQTDYHQAVEHLGLERGIERSGATHEPVRSHYTRLNSQTITLNDTPSTTGLLDEKDFTINKSGNAYIKVVKAEVALTSLESKWKSYTKGCLSALGGRFEKVKADLQYFRGKVSDLKREVTRLYNIVGFIRSKHPEIVAEAERAEELGRLSRKGVKGALAPLGTHSTLLRKERAPSGEKQEQKQEQTTKTTIRLAI